MLEMLPLSVFLLWCRSPLFTLSTRGLEFLLFDGGTETLLKSQ
jgi:hypothetical protein